MVLGSVVGLETPAGLVEGAKLHGNTGADTDKRRQSPFIEGKWPLGLIDSLRRHEGVGVRSCGLQSNLDDIEGLAFKILAKLYQIDAESKMCFWHIKTPFS